MIGLVARLKDWDYLRKWLILGASIGVVAGLGAIAFIFALEATTKLLLGTIGGYEPPLPIGEGNRLAAGHFTRPWAIPLVVGFGGLVSGILVFRFAPEAEGHGTDAAIAAVHHNPRGSAAGSRSSSCWPPRQQSARGVPEGGRDRPPRSAPGSGRCWPVAWS